MPSLNFSGEADLQTACVSAWWRKGPIVDKVTLMSIIFPMTGFAKTQSLTWDKDPQNFVSDLDRAKITMSIRSISGVGQDEHRSTTVGDGTNNLYVTEIDEVGIRQFVLSLRAESYDKSAESGEILDAVRSQLQTQATADTLAQINLAFQDAQLASDLPTTYDNRVVNVAVLDVFFNAVAGGGFGFAAPASPAFVQTVNTNNIVPGTFS